MPQLPPRKKKKQMSQYSKPEYGSFYHTTAWRKLRNQFIRTYPTCAMCKKLGILTAGEVVDHIKPISEGGEALDVNNLQTLCNACHATKTAKETFKRNNTL